MTCLNPRCAAAIPDDSAFCDQCGSAQGSGSASGLIVQGAAITPDSVMPSSPIPVDPPATAVNPQPITRADAATAFADRPVRPMDPAVLRLGLSDGTQVDLVAGDVMGQGEGPLALHWGDAGLVSGRHGQVQRQAGQWTYTDLFSANGSTLNGHFVRPGKAVALQSGDKLVLGNRSCTVL